MLVTGGSGFIAAHCIAELLAQGSSVRTTVRSLSRADHVRRLVDQTGQDGSLVEVVVADLTADAGWPEALAGCQGADRAPEGPGISDRSQASASVPDPDKVGRESREQVELMSACLTDLGFPTQMREDGSFEVGDVTAEQQASPEDAMTIAPIRGASRHTRRAQASMTIGMIIGRRRSLLPTNEPTVRRMTCCSW